jgi:hypothetical protein
MVKALIQGKVSRFGVPALGASLLALGIGTAVASTASSAKTCSTPTTALHFQTAKFHPPHVHVCTRKAHEAHGAIFLAPIKNGAYKFVGQSGALLEDQGGHVVWFHPAAKGDDVADFQTATYDKQPVLTFWQGKLAIPPANTTLPPGTPVKGSLFIYNDHYQKIKTIKAKGKGWVTDFHDLVFTPPTKTYSKGTALFLADKTMKGGGAPGGFEDQEIQEINLANNKLVWSWDEHKYIGAHTSHVKPPSKGVWDPYHANSIDIQSAGGLPDGHVLLSLRDTWGIYDINHANKKKFVWKLINGKGSTYKLAKAAKFQWQHDVHFVGKHELSIFDDNCCNLQPIQKANGPARGLLLTLKGKSATVAHQYKHANTNVILTMGSFRVIGPGHAFIGWGQAPYFSEYTKGGTMIYDAAMPKGDITYRALKSKWTGLPGTKAIGIAVKKVSGKAIVWASWNGATKVAKWKVLAGKTKGKVNKAAGTGTKTSFETEIHASNLGPYFKVEALDSHGHVLGTSKVTKL